MTWRHPWTKRKTTMLIAGAMLAGATIQAITDWTPFNNHPEVYEPPSDFSVTRYDNVIFHKASGQRNVACNFSLPFIVEFRTSYGRIVASELLRSFQTIVDVNILDQETLDILSQDPEVAARLDRREANQDTIFVQRLPENPNKFEAVQFIVVDNKKVFQEADRFIITSKCISDEYGIIDGEFGPFPIPGNQKTFTQTNASELSNNVNWSAYVPLALAGITYLIILIL